MKQLLSYNEFFKKEKFGIVENTNNELVLYHGTQANFDVFDQSYINTGWGKQEYGYGFYLTDYYQAAKEYSKGGKVIKVYVPGKKYLSYKGITLSEKRNIANKFFKYYTEVDEYGKEAYSTPELKKDFWNEECKYLIECNDGGDIYGTIASILGSDKETSEFLKSIGYVGIKFPCSNGRTGEKFTNYVIFDAKDIEIIK